METRKSLTKKQSKAKITNGQTINSRKSNLQRKKRGKPEEKCVGFEKQVHPSWSDRQDSRKYWWGVLGFKDDQIRKLLHLVRNTIPSAPPTKLSVTDFKSKSKKKICMTSITQKDAFLWPNLNEYMGPTIQASRRK